MIVRILICDMCSAEGMPDCGRRTMREYGWVVVGQNGSDVDMCPRCSGSQPLNPPGA